MFGDGTLSPDAGARATGVITLVGKNDGARRKPLKQRFGSGDVVVVAL